jgi:hypothetical protein
MPSSTSADRSRCPMVGQAVYDLILAVQFPPAQMDPS